MSLESVEIVGMASTKEHYVKGPPGPPVRARGVERTHIIMTTAKLNTLKSGSYFLCGYAEVWAVVRPHHAHQDVFLARRVRDGFETCFCGGAEFKLPTAAEIDHAKSRRQCSSIGGPEDCYDIDCPACN